MKHPHDEKIRQALDEMEKFGGSLWEENQKGEWLKIVFSSKTYLNFNPNFQYRKPPRKLFQKRVEIPEPVRDAGVMRIGQRYYSPSWLAGSGYLSRDWEGSEIDMKRLKDGLVYLTPEDAIKRADAGLAVEYDI